MKECLLDVWKRRSVMLIVVALQFVMNLIGLSLADGVQKGLMVSSGIVFLLMSVYGCYLQRKNILGFVLNIVLLYFNYSLVASVYWNAGNLHRLFAKYEWSDFLRCINIVMVFYASYLCTLKETLSVDRRIFLEKYSPNYLVVLGCAAYIAVAPLLFYHTETFGIRGQAGAPYEYSLVVLIAGLRFTGRKVKPLALLLAASMWMMAHGLLHGERVLALQMAIVWALYLAMQWISLKLIIPVGVVGIFVLTMFGKFRGVNALQGNFLETVFNTLLKGGLANDTSFAAFQSGMNILRLEDVTFIGSRIFLGIKYLLYVVLGNVIEDVHLTTLALAVGWHGGGGWLAFYAHFWLGYPGVILFGMAVGWLVNKTTALEPNRLFVNFMALYVVATSPRWYLYSPAPLTRGMLIFMAFYGAAMLGDRWSRQFWNWLKAHLRKKPAVQEAEKTEE